MDYPGSSRGDDVYINNYLDNTKQIKQEIATNQYIVTEYDEPDRVKKVTYPEGRVTKYYYDGAGRIVKTADTSSLLSSLIEYEYDLTGNVKRANHTYDGYSFEIGYGYDEKGNVTGITYPGGYTVSYEYDQYDRVVRMPQFVEGLPVTNPDPGIPPNPKPGDPGYDDPVPIDPRIMSIVPLATTTGPGVKYKANGFMEELRYVNGVITTFTDDSLGRVQTIRNIAMELTYDYDGKGNVTSIRGMNGSTVASTYAYYDNDWLKTATQGPNTYAYIYDAAGNCTQKTAKGVVTAYTYDANSLNLLRSAGDHSYTNDRRGNMTGWSNSSQSYTYTYYDSNELKTVTKTGGNVVGRYYYNSEGKRYKKVEEVEGENGKQLITTYYVYSGELLLYEYEPNGKAVYYIYLNGKQIARVERVNGVDNKSFYHTDHLGSTRAITDAQGNVVGRFEYEPFGAEESHTGQDGTLTYTGKMEDDPTGLMYFNARYYDPMLGRFMTEDPVKDGGNWYLYCANSPLRYVDSTGKNIHVAAANVASIDGPLLIGDLFAIGMEIGYWGGYIWNIYGNQIVASLSQPNTEVKEKTITITSSISDSQKPRETLIYRKGSTTYTNLTPRPQDITGLSFSLIPPIGDKYSVTTIEEINNTGVLIAFIDRPGHVSVIPINGDLAEWIASRPNAENNPHPYTLLIKSKVKPMKPIVPNK